MDVMQLRRNLLTMPTSRLPSGYQEVKYLQSSGTQYIYTDVEGSTGVECVANVMLMSGSSNDCTILGARKDSSDRIMLIHQYPSNKWTIGYGSSHTGLGAFNYSTKYKVEAKCLQGEQLLKVYDSVLYQDNGTSVISNNFNLALFACSYGASDIRLYSKSRVYDLVVKKDGNVVLDYIPCIRISDSIPGMYDMVTGNFYINSGTGQFGYEMLNGTVVNPV